MSKAKEKALEAYPEHSVLIRPARRGGYYADNHLREGFIKGYEQAEKDLGWHSVKESLPPVGEEIIALCNEVNGTTLPTACYMCFAHLVEDKTIFVEYNGWNIPGVKYWMPCPELPE